MQLNGSTNNNAPTVNAEIASLKSQLKRQQRLLTGLFLIAGVTVLTGAALTERSQISVTDANGRARLALSTGTGGKDSSSLFIYDSKTRPRVNLMVDEKGKAPVAMLMQSADQKAVLSATINNDEAPALFMMHSNGARIGLLFNKGVPVLHMRDAEGKEKIISP